MYNIMVKLLFIRIFQFNCDLILQCYFHRVQVVFLVSQEMLSLLITFDKSKKCLSSLLLLL